MKAIKTERKYKKEKSVITLTLFLCPCSGVVEDVGSAGCSHDDTWTYFGQCRLCKSVFSQDYSFEKDDPTKYGWVIVE